MAGGARPRPPLHATAGPACVPAAVGGGAAAAGAQTHGTALGWLWLPARELRALVDEINLDSIRNNGGDVSLFELIELVLKRLRRHDDALHLLLSAFFATAEPGTGADTARERRQPGALGFERFLLLVRVLSPPS